MLAITCTNWIHDMGQMTARDERRKEVTCNRFAL
jgi:hypothetical protein